MAVIVPVFRGRADTLACLDSVQATTDARDTEVIVIDDASPDPALKRDLREMAKTGLITLVENDQNRGFPHSVNRGMALRPGHDVVLLNADAEVYDGWLERLRDAAYEAGDVGTVSPFSNNGSMMAYPGDDATPIGPAQGARLDRLFASLNPGRRIELPGGAGFCLFIRRACIDQTGAFDEAAFGRGYGEENDFCERARNLGWRHVGATDVFVRHVGGRSFGALKRLLIESNLKVLYRRHPRQYRAMGRFLKTDPIRPLRRAADEALLAEDPAPSVLLITLARGGGVARHAQERARALRAERLRVIELRPAKETDAKGACRLTVAGRPFDDLEYRLPEEFEHLTGLLRRLNIGRIEVHHVLGLDPAVLTLPEKLGAPFDLYVHDYSWICPRITLIGGDARYCGEPALDACERCVVQNGSLIEEDITVIDLRARTASLAAAAQRVIVPTRDVARRLERYLPAMNVEVRAWEPVPSPAPPPARAQRGEPIRVAVLGAIGEHKGYHRLLACARDAAARDLPLSFVVIGHSQDDPPLFETGRVFVTGPYDEPEVPALLTRERCDVALLASVWPETWCYALTHVLASGLPIAAFDLGAMSERLEGVERARLLDLDTDAASLNEALIDLARPGARVSVRTRDQRLEGADPWVEAFKIEATGAFYQGILAGGAPTRWTAGPAWCGDPSGSRPLLGFAIRGAGKRCRYTGTFSSGARMSAADGAACHSPMQNDPLVGIEVELSEEG